MFRKRDDEDPDEGQQQAGAPGGVNREMKRAMEKRERSADRLRRPPPSAKKKRTKPRQFVKEVKGELTRVAWPTRSEVVTYSMVVVVTLAFFVIIISGIDFGALKGVLFLLSKGGK